jgi:hypothetical protein
LIWSSGWDLGSQTLSLADDLLGLLAKSGAPDDEIADMYYLIITFLFGFVFLESQSPDTPGFSKQSNSGSWSDKDAFPNLSRYAPAADKKGMDRRFERGVTRVVNSLLP